MNETNENKECYCGFTALDIVSGTKSESRMHFLKELQERQDKFQTLRHGELAITGIPTGFMEIDKIINGLNNSHLIILAARPSMGKTSLALNIAENVCFQSNVPVGIFSLDLTSHDIVNRIIASQSEVELEKIKDGSISGMEYQRVVESFQDMQKCPMIIDASPKITIDEICSRAHKMKEKYDIGLLVIDYLQLVMQPKYMILENRHEKMTEISHGLKYLARELDIPILCTSQLSRKVEERTGHRPMINDLRDSGTIEEDADAIIFLLRRELYDALDKPGRADMIVGKNNHGNIGEAFLTFRKEITQFANYSGCTMLSEHEVFKQNIT